MKKNRITDFERGQWSVIQNVISFMQDYHTAMELCREAGFGKSKVLELETDSDTPSGLMKVCECQVCFSKFRYHGLHGSLETFLDSLEEDVTYQEKGLEAWSELTLKRKKHEI